MIRRLGLSEKKAKLLQKIGDGSKIDCRYMVFKGEEEIFFGRKGLGNDEGIEARNTVFKREAIPLSLKSAQAALDDWKGQKEDITHVVAVTCTGVIIPGLEFHIMQGLGLSTKAERLSIQFMGCFGALSGMKAARSIAAEDPRYRVLVVCTELCSLHLQMDDRVENLVASALFADGSGAMVIGCQPRQGERALFEIHHSASHIIPNTLEMMKWELSHTGMIIGLDRHISNEIYENIVPFAQRLLGPDIQAKQCAWAIHPGGPMVIKAITDALKLEDSDARAGWEILRKFGNMSSASLIFVFDEMRRTKVRSGRWVPTLAFGPGLNVEGAMLRAC
jgi:predicted naringenin-chalcone synthase